MFRPATVILCIVLAFPTWVGALALGDIESRSHLSQRLDASIPLIGIQPADVDEMAVSLGSAAQFRRAGIDRPFYLTQLRFTVEDNGDGTGSIRVTTRSPVNEPFLNFLLEVSWPTGRVVREYTLLLDPPVYAAAIDAKARKQLSDRAKQSNRGAISPPRPPPSPSIPARTNSSRGNSYGPVGRNDTLWRIASQTRPNEDVSVQQMMLALVRANPEAFAANNVNSLRAGAVLSVPDLRAITAIDSAQAINEVKRHNADWGELRAAINAGTVLPPLAGSVPPAQRRTTTGRATPAPAQVTQQSSNATRPAPVPPPAEVAQGKVEIGGDREQVSGAGTTERGDGDIAALESRLDTALEELSQVQSQVNSLSAKLAEADSLINDMTRLIAARDAELARLQSKLAETEAKALQVATAAAAVSNGSPAPTPAPVTTEQPATAPAVPAPTTIAAPSPPAAPVTPEPEPSSLMDMVMEALDELPVDPLILAGGLLGLLVMVVLALMLRRRARRRSGTSIKSDTSKDLEEVMLSRELSDDDTFDEPAESAPMAAVLTAKAPTVLRQRDDKTQLLGGAEEEEDSLAEVNVYLAYERFDQAENVVRDAIAKYPERHQYRVKLLEVLHAARNRKGFIAAMAELGAVVGEEHESMVAAHAMEATLEPDTVEIAEGSEIFDTVDGELDFDLGFEVDESDDTRIKESVTGEVAEEETQENSAAVMRVTANGDDIDDWGLNFEEDLSQETDTTSNTGLGMGLDSTDGLAAPNGDVEADVDFDFDLSEVEPVSDLEMESLAGIDTNVLDFDVALGSQEDQGVESVAEGTIPSKTQAETHAGQTEQDGVDTVTQKPGVDLDLDLDFDLDFSEDEQTAAPDTLTITPEPVDFDFNFDDDPVSEEEETSVAPSFDTVQLSVSDNLSQASSVDGAGVDEDAELDFDFDLGDLGSTEGEFNFGSDGLDLPLDGGELALSDDQGPSLVGEQNDDSPLASGNELLGNNDFASPIDEQLALPSDEELVLPEDDEFSLADELRLPEAGQLVLAEEEINYSEKDSDVPVLDISFDIEEQSGDRGLSFDLGNEDILSPSNYDGTPALVLDDDNDSSVSLEINFETLSEEEATGMGGIGVNSLNEAFDQEPDTLEAPTVPRQAASNDLIGDNLGQPVNHDSEDPLELMEAFDEVTGADSELPLDFGVMDDEFDLEIDTTSDSTSTLDVPRVLASEDSSMFDVPTVVVLDTPVADNDDDVLDLDLNDFDPLMDAQDAAATEQLPESGALASESGALDLGLSISDEETMEAPPLKMGLNVLSDVEFDEPSSPNVSLDTIDDDVEDYYLDTSTLVLGARAEDIDEMQTRLDLAEQYISMGENEAAEEILEEVLAEGNDAHKATAQALRQLLS